MSAECAKPAPVAGINQKTNIMYAIKNKIQLIGSLAQAPEIKELEDGKKMARFSVSTTETYHNAKGEKVTETQFHSIAAFGKLAEIAEKYLNKGSEVAIEGKLINNNYTDKVGVNHFVTEVHVTDMLMLGKSNRQG